MAFMGSGDIHNPKNEKDGETTSIVEKPEKWHKQWWVRIFSAGLIVSLIAYYFFRSFDFSLAIVCGSAVYALLVNPKRRFYRAAFRVLSIGLSTVGMINLLPALNTQFNFIKVENNQLLEFFFRLNIDEEPWLNALLLILTFGLAGYLFYRDSQID